MNMITFPKLTFLFLFTFLTSDLFAAADSSWDIQHSSEWQQLPSLFQNLNDEQDISSFDQPINPSSLNENRNLNPPDTCAEAFELSLFSVQQQNSFFQYNQHDEEDSSTYEPESIFPAMFTCDFISFLPETYSPSTIPDESLTPSHVQLLSLNPGDNSFSTYRKRLNPAERAQTSSIVPQREKRTRGRSDSYKCPHEGCIFTTDYQYTLIRHIRSHSYLKPFKCIHDGCTYNTDNQSLLAEHMRKHSGKKTFKCTRPGCFFSSIYQANFTKHMRKHTGVKLFKCTHNDCIYVTDNQSHLNEHMRRHTGEKPFKCTHNDCSFASATKSNLTTHMRTHTGEKPFKCTQEGCYFASITNTHLKYHLKSHSSETQTDKQQRTQSASSFQDNVILSTDNDFGDSTEPI